MPPSCHIFFMRFFMLFSFLVVGLLYVHYEKEWLVWWALSRRMVLVPVLLPRGLMIPLKSDVDTEESRESPFPRDTDIHPKDVQMPNDK